MQEIINKLEIKLQSELPGETAQYLMAPLSRPKLEQMAEGDKHFRLSAVLILFCKENGNWFLPLTVRFDYKGAHSGQVSLPGGKFDPADTDLTHTALRECEEEIGLKDGIQVIGKLSRLYIPVSNFMVHPVVAFCSHDNLKMHMNAREVKQIIRLNLQDLLNDEIVKNDWIEIDGIQKIKAPYFEIEGFKVWGATAMILSELKYILRTIF